MINPLFFALFLDPQFLIGFQEWWSSDFKPNFPGDTYQLTDKLFWA
jgi:hypothetical protein